MADALENIEEILDNEELWDSLRKKLALNNKQLWETIWRTGGESAFQLGSKRVAKELGITWEDIPFRGQQYYLLHGEKLTEQLTETDLSGLRNLIKEHWGIGEKAFASKVDDQVASPVRLKNIYRTEIHYSNEYAGLHQALDAGVENPKLAGYGRREDVRRMCIPRGREPGRANF